MKSKDKNILIVLGVVIFIVVVGFFVYRIRRNPETGLKDFFNEPVSQDIGIDFNKLPSEKIFNDPLQDDIRFKQLKSYFVEVKSGKKGRKNPFVN